MKAHETQLDEHSMTRARNEMCGLHPDSTPTKVRSGQIGEHRGVLSQRTLELLDERWRASVEKETGLPDHGALRSALARECSGAGPRERDAWDTRGGPHPAARYRPLAESRSERTQ